MADKILVIEDADSLRLALSSVLTAEGYLVQDVSTGEEALRYLNTEDFSIIISDLKLPGISALEILRESKKLKGRIPMIVMTAYGSIETAVEAMREGASNFISKPFDTEILCKLIRDTIESKTTNNLTPDRDTQSRNLIYQSSAMEQLMLQARKVSALTSPVLILGESGTGKELIARYIHKHSPRSSENFVAVNCSSMPGGLLESEFFGHEAGSFTGAIEKRIGLFEVANNGTIFLDEIGTMPSSLQTKLLRTIQESEIKKLGSSRVQKIDVRIISATNSNLLTGIREEKFREDLYYRLGVVILEIPPLRERPDDIELLANYLLKKFALAHGKSDCLLSESSLYELKNYNWPGNVRELENIMERAVIFHQGVLEPSDLELPTWHKAKEHIPSNSVSLHAIADDALRRCETGAILNALKTAKGNKSRAAKLLGVSYKTLLNKIKIYRIEIGDKKLQR